MSMFSKTSKPAFHMRLCVDVSIGDGGVFMSLYVFVFLCVDVILYFVVSFFWFFYVIVDAVVVVVVVVYCFC